MRIAQILAGFSLAEADVLRKAVGKKDAELIAKELGGSWRRRWSAARPPRDPGPGGPDRGVRPLRLQQVALRGVRAALLSDGVAQVPLPGRVHGGADELRGGQGGRRGGLHRRLPRAGQVPAGEVPEGLEVLPPHVNESNWKFTVVGEGVGPSASGSARSAAWARARCARSSPRARRRVRSARCSTCSPHRPAALQQAGAGGADLRRRAGRLRARGRRAQLLAGLDATFAAAQDVQRERESSQEASSATCSAEETRAGGDPGAAAARGRALDGDRSGSSARRRSSASSSPGTRWTSTARRWHSSTGEHGEPQGAPRPEGRAGLRGHRGGAADLQARRLRVGPHHRGGLPRHRHRARVRRQLGANKDALVKDAPVLIRGGVSGRERDEEDPPIFLDGVVPLDAVREGGEIGVCIELGSDGCDAERWRRRRRCSPAPGPRAPDRALAQRRPGDGLARARSPPASAPARCASRRRPRAAARARSWGRRGGG
jgi:DNA polymerase III subunit alpha